MNNKIKLLEYAANRIANEEDFMAFLLNKYIAIENVSDLTLIELLGCTKEDYYKLCLCKTPDVNSPDYLEKVKELSQYTNTQIFELNKIIKRYYSIINLSQNKQSILMAARDKQEKKDED